MMGNLLAYMCLKRIIADETDATTTTDQPQVKTRIAINCSCCQSATTQTDDEETT